MAPSEGNKAELAHEWPKVPDAPEPSQRNPIPTPYDGVLFDPAEPAVKFRYCQEQNCWKKEQITIRMSGTPLGQGCMRVAFPMVEYHAGAEVRCAAKLSKQLHDARAIYFSEVRMQAKCVELAKEFNKFNPPKEVHFLDAWVIECKRRRHPSGKGCLALVAEYLLEGQFCKYNSNIGFVNADLMRFTPHAFSHWSYHFTRGELLVCDIQGVDDIYTDPQIHSNTDDGWLYGKGDFGKAGIQKFFHTHTCNPVCRFLQLPEREPLQIHPPVYWRPLEELVPPEVVDRIISSFWRAAPEDPPVDDGKPCVVAAYATAVLAVIAVKLQELQASLPVQKVMRISPSPSVSSLGPQPSEEKYSHCSGRSSSISSASTSECSTSSNNPPLPDESSFQLWRRASSVPVDRMDWTTLPDHAKEHVWQQKSFVETDIEAIASKVAYPIYLPQGKSRGGKTSGMNSKTTVTIMSPGISSESVSVSLPATPLRPLYSIRSANPVFSPPAKEGFTASPASNLLRSPKAEMERRPSKTGPYTPNKDKLPSVDDFVQSRLAIFGSPPTSVSASSAQWNANWSAFPPTLSPTSSGDPKPWYDAQQPGRMNSLPNQPSSAATSQMSNLAMWPNPSSTTYGAFQQRLAYL